jgi:hypothetical protein
MVDVNDWPFVSPPGTELVRYVSLGFRIIPRTSAA